MSRIPLIGICTYCNKEVDLRKPNHCFCKQRSTKKILYYHEECYRGYFPIVGSDWVDDEEKK